MRSLAHDIRYAFRTLRKNPILTVVALLSLGIGIGANTAIFTIMDRVLLRALPVRQPEQLVLLASPGGWSGSVETSYNDEVVLSWPKYRTLRDQSAGIFDGLIARCPFDVSLASQSQTDASSGELVTGNYFDVLGVRPALGRLVSNDDTVKVGSNPVAVLSYGYWTRRFGGSAAVLNQSITVNGTPLTIVGVAQQGFLSVGAGESPAVFVPITMQPKMIPGWEDVSELPHGYWINVFGRLKPNLSRERAEAAIGVVWHRILADDVKLVAARAGPAYRARYVNRKLELRPAAGGISSIRDNVATPLYLLMGMVGLVLLIACANVANLLLARAAAREKEIAIRIALGASRGRLIRHLLAESMILSLGGGLAGVFIATWAGSLMLRMLPQGLPTAGITADPDTNMLAFAFAISVLTGLLFGCVPALRATRPDVAPTLKEQTAALSTGGHARFRKGLVVAQIALSALLLASAGLFAHSLYNLRTLDPGFHSDRLVTFSIDPSLNGYTPERTLRLFADIQRALPSMPGVSGASMAKWPLLTNSDNMGGYEVEGYVPPDGRGVTIHRNRVGAGFFSLMGIPLVAGREFHEADAMGAPLVAVVNESLARKYFDRRNPLGLHIAYRRKNGVAAIEIVGIVKDSKYDDLREDPMPFVYFPAAQDTGPGTMTFYARTTLAPESLSTALRQVVQRLDASLPVTGPKPMPEQIMESVYVDRLVAALSCTFAAFATVLAAVGLYGVIAWAVTRRKREIGIRMALGAHPGEVMRMILKEVLWMGAIGIAIAAPVWVAAARLLQSQLYGVTTHDPLTLVLSVLVLSVVAAAAGFVPAFRAARVDPISAIRYE
jgi:predicted permease